MSLPGINPKKTKTQLEKTQDTSVHCSIFITDKIRNLSIREWVKRESGVCIGLCIAFLKDTSEPDSELYSFLHEPSTLCQNVKAHVTHLSKTVHENLTKINKNMHRINRYVG